jgi:hypothetical protein
LRAWNINGNPYCGGLSTAEEKKKTNSVLNIGSHPAVLPITVFKILLINKTKSAIKSLMWSVPWK